eukprot:scaffold5203_cov60-Phaeocystis_antarctica.AAC.1
MGYGREARDEADRAERASHTAFPRSAFGGTVASHRSFAPPLQPHPQPGHSLGKRACAVPKYPVNYVGCTHAGLNQRFSTLLMNLALLILMANGMTKKP